MQIFLDSSFLLLIFLVFISAIIIAYLIVNRDVKLGKDKEFSASKAEGEPRHVFVLIYLLVAWACFVFFLPVIIYLPQGKELISSTSDRFLLLLKVLPAPIIFFLVLLLGSKRNFLSWITDLDWPNMPNSKKDE